MAGRIAVAFPLPGATPTESMTEQRILTRTPPSDDREREEAEFARDWFYDVTYGEDYLTGYGVQRGIPAMQQEAAGHARGRFDVQDLGVDDLGREDRGSWVIPEFETVLERCLAWGLYGEQPAPAEQPSLP